jgi:hypothetical protein
MIEGPDQVLVVLLRGIDQAGDLGGRVLGGPGVDLGVGRDAAKQVDVEVLDVALLEGPAARVSQIVEEVGGGLPRPDTGLKPVEAWRWLGPTPVDGVPSTLSDTISWKSIGRRLYRVL